MRCGLALLRAHSGKIMVVVGRRGGISHQTLTAQAKECRVSKAVEIAAILIDIEALLRQLGQWDLRPPSPEALVSSEPFCVDTLTLPQWLQFVFLPTLYRMMDEGNTLPDRCGIAPMAEEYFRGTGLASTELEASLQRIDELLSAEFENIN